MNLGPKISASAADDAYTDRSQRQVASKQDVDLDGHKYTVFGYKSDSVTGFHGTAYLSKETGEVIIAYRGTDPDIKGHTLTTLQDAAVDATMVRDKVNPQIAVADAFTKEVLEKAHSLGIPKDHVTVAGHSLGGTLAEIEAAKFGLSGATFNAFGAVGIAPNVPEGDTKVTNYVMAGDVVSAGNHHYGQMVVLASPEDIHSMKVGRYLDAPAGSSPPNPFLSMSLGDHSVTHFTGPNSVLKPDTLAQYEKNYTDHKGAIDAYRNDVYRERGELSEALRVAQGRGTPAQLPPDIQRNLNEYLAVNADPAIQKAIEQSAKVTGIEQGLQQGADVARAAGHYVQSQDERVASAVRTTGDAMMPLSPAAPLVGMAMGEAAQLHGQAAHAVGDFVADKLQSAKEGVVQGAHHVSEAIKAGIHSPGVQAVALNATNGIVDTYQGVVSAAHAVEQRYNDAKHAVSHGIDATEQKATQVYDATRHAVSHGIDAAERTATQAYDATRQAASHGIQATERTAAHAYDATRQTISHGIDAARQGVSNAYDAVTHPGQWFGAQASPGPGVSTPASPHGPTNDPRHSASPTHALYNQLHERIPAASEERLLQFTAACHANGITDKNLKDIHFDEAKGVMKFDTGGLVRHMASVDLHASMPTPDQAIQQIQQHDQHKLQIQEHIQAQNAQRNAQAQHGPMLGGR